MPFTEVNGVALRYEHSGRGERTLVLIHEMGGSLESWDEVAPALAANRRMLRYDTRGGGLSEKVRGARSIDTMVDDLAALLDALEPVARAIPGARYRVLKTSHYMAVATPELLADTIAAFLDEAGT